MFSFICKIGSLMFDYQWVSWQLAQQRKHIKRTCQKSVNINWQTSVSERENINFNHRQSEVFTRSLKNCDRVLIFYYLFLMFGGSTK